MRLRYGGWWWLLWRCWFVERIECDGCAWAGRVHYRVSIGPLELWVDVP